ncbi:hypothetical protein SLA2020_325080 [Shorea laevis]
MSFYLLPKSVIGEIDKIRRRFLWGGTSELKKVAWVAWKNVCLSKLDGGLGIKNLLGFNISLLGKWWGRLITEKGGLWRRVLSEIYGNSEGNWLSHLREGRYIGSKWWKDVCKIDEGMGIKKDWLSSGFTVDLGNGGRVKFWTDVWAEGCTLSNKFPRLFMLAADQDCKVIDMGAWSENCWKWNLSWKRPLRTWEEDLVKELVETLKLRAPNQNKENRWH